MKRLISTMALLAFGLTGHFTYAQESESKAEITFETETIDYGTIDQGSDGTREFKFKNTGNEPLVINNARGSCGCTVPTWPREPIAPGEEGVIKVKYATNRVGKFTKTVTITYNDNRSKKLTIKGNVLAKDKDKKKDNSKGDGAPVKKDSESPVKAK